MLKDNENVMLKSYDYGQSSLSSRPLVFLSPLVPLFPRLLVPLSTSSLPNPMKRYALILFLLVIVVFGYAQNNNYPNIPVVDILRYQVQKSRKGVRTAPFKRYGLRRIRASKFLADNDSRHIWGWHLQADETFDADREELYKLFKRADLSSMGIIDVQDGGVEVVFWDKQYYRRFSQELKKIGFVCSDSRRATNILEFRKPESSILVDFTIWPNIYIMYVYSAK